MPASSAPNVGDPAGEHQCRCAYQYTKLSTQAAWGISAPVVSHSAPPCIPLSAKYTTMRYSNIYNQTNPGFEPSMALRRDPSADGRGCACACPCIFRVAARRGGTHMVRGVTTTPNANCANQVSGPRLKFSTREAFQDISSFERGVRPSFRPSSSQDTWSKDIYSIYIYPRLLISRAAETRLSLHIYIYI